MAIHQLVRAVGARDDHPVVAVNLDRAVVDRLDLDQWAEHGVETRTPERVEERGRVRSRSGDDHPHRHRSVTVVSRARTSFAATLAVGRRPGYLIAERSTSTARLIRTRLLRARRQ